MRFEALVRLDDPEPHSAALNMAIDEALLRGAKQPLLRCYRWERPAVSFGYFGKVAEVESAWPGRELVRRWTGGGIVPHGEDFTYSVIVPRTHPFCALRTACSYRAIHEAVLRALSATGREIVFASPTSDRVSDACFENAVEHDLVVGSAKVAGAAQRRTQFGVLHQGSIQLEAMPSDFARLLAAALAETIESHPLTEATLSAAEQLAAEKYATEKWLRRA